MLEKILIYGFVAFMIYGFYQLCEKPHHKSMYKIAVVILILMEFASGYSSDCRYIGFLSRC
jgi:hypothetical protein